MVVVCKCVWVQVEFGKDGSLKASERISGLGEKGASPRGGREGSSSRGSAGRGSRQQRGSHGGGGGGGGEEGQGQEDDRSSKEKESQRARPKGRSSASRRAQAGQAERTTPIISFSRAHGRHRINRQAADGEPTEATL